ncbi:MAG: polyprenyl synthetase family protein [Terrimicrobiaceae bacterium]
MSLNEYFRKSASLVDRYLNRWLPTGKVRPGTLHEAMRYSLFAGGKRMRPILCLAAADCCCGSPEAALPSAAAIECIHTYSLIHDDLPCMDDDDLRRGRPTAHIQFGEGIAVLAGDALLTAAFEIIAETPPTKRYPTAAFVRELARAAGSRFLVGGQVADLEGEGQTLSKRALKFIHEGKTAAMIAVSLRLGAMSANAPEDVTDLLAAFGRKLGHAFQVIDDILDVTQTSQELGKSAGKDARDSKSTYPAVIGIEASRQEARKLTNEAIRCLSPLGRRATRLREIAAHLLDRHT